MDEERIKLLMQQGENETTEFKTFKKLENLFNERKAFSNGYKKDLAVLFAALANKMGGIILFGITNDRKLEGYKLTPEKFEKFAQILIEIADRNCNPPIHPENIRQLNVRRNHLLQIEVPPRKSKPHAVDGIFYVRVGSHNIPVTDPTKIEELLLGNKEIKEDLTDEEHEKMILEDTLKLTPKILINGYEIPYLKIKSRGRATCLLFGRSFGFLNGAYYTYTTTHSMAVNSLEEILKTFYVTFGAPFGDDPSFMINQVCNDTKVRYSWFGYGHRNFVEALREQDRRYLEAGIMSPHHREVAGFVDDRQDYIFYIGLQPNVTKKGRRLTFDYVDVGFIFSSMPFDNSKFIDFYKRANLPVPDFTHCGNGYLKFKHGDFRQKSSKLNKEGLVLYRTRSDEEYWTSKVICKNPFFENKTVDPYLSWHEKIIINLRDHHPVSDSVQYFLEDFRIVPIPYSGFNFALLNIRGNW